MSFFSRIFGPSRTKQLQVVASALDLGFEVNPSQNLIEMLSDFEVIARAKETSIEHLFSYGLETKERALRIFDCRLEFGSKHDTNKIENTSILLFTFSRNFLPHFILKPKNVFNRIDSRLATDKKITVPEDPEFNTAFIIQAGLKEEVLAILNDRFRAKAKMSSGFTIEGMSHFLMMYAPNQLIHPNENSYGNLINYMYELADTLDPNRI